MTILSLARDAAAQDETVSGPQADPTLASQPEAVMDATLRLDLAVRAYQSGQYEEARTSLALLVNDPSVSDAVLRQQARVYLGEILYVQGQEDAAFKVFETVLLEDESFKIDPFKHPPDVCGFFEVVRASVSAPPDNQISVQTVPMARGAWAGFGAWQRTHGYRRVGNLLMSGQVLLGTTSLITHAMLLQDRSYTVDSPEETRLFALRAVQWSSTAGFWGLYAWGTLDAQRRIREGERVGAVAPIGVGVSGRW